MNSCALAADIVFAGAPAQVSPSSVADKRPLSNPGTNKASDLPASSVPRTPPLAEEAPQTPVGQARRAGEEDNRKTDNISASGRSGKDKKRPPEFARAFGAAVAANASQRTENSGASARQSLIRNLAEPPKTGSLKQSQNGTAAEVGPKVGYELSRLLARPEADNLISIAAKTPAPAGNRTQLNSGQGRIAAKPGMHHILKWWPVISSDSADGINAAPGKPLWPIGVSLGQQQSGKELMPKGFVAVSGNTAETGKRLGVVRTSNITGTQETPTPAGKDRDPAALNTPDGIEKAVAERAPLSSGAKTPELDTNLSAAQTKASRPGPGFNGIDMGESAETAERPAVNSDPGGRTLSFTTGRHHKDFEPAGSNSLSGRAHVQQLSVTGLQTKDQTNSTSDYGSEAGREPTVPNTNPDYPPSADLSDTSVRTTQAENNNAAGQTFPGVREQLFESIRSSLGRDEQQLTIRLHPPELGQVSVRFQEQQTQITGVLEVSKAQTKYEIEHALPEVIKSLQEAGVQIRRLEVVLTDQPEQQLFRDQSLQYGSFQQNPSSESNNPGNGPPQEWPANDDGYQDLSEPQLAVADGSINMLV